MKLMVNVTRTDISPPTCFHHIVSKMSRVCRSEGYWSPLFVSTNRTLKEAHGDGLNCSNIEVDQCIRLISNFQLILLEIVGKWTKYADLRQFALMIGGFIFLPHLLINCLLLCTLRRMGRDKRTVVYEYQWVIVGCDIVHMSAGYWLIGWVAQFRMYYNNLHRRMWPAWLFSYNFAIPLVYATQLNSLLCTAFVCRDRRNAIRTPMDYRTWNHGRTAARLFWIGLTASVIVVFATYRTERWSYYPLHSGAPMPSSLPAYACQRLDLMAGEICTVEPNSSSAAAANTIIISPKIKQAVKYFESNTKLTRVLANGTRVSMYEFDRIPTELLEDNLVYLVVLLGANFCLLVSFLSLLREYRSAMKTRLELLQHRRRGTAGQRTNGQSPPLKTATGVTDEDVPVTTSHPKTSKSIQPAVRKMNQHQNESSSTNNQNSAEEEEEEERTQKEKETIRRRQKEQKDNQRQKTESERRQKEKGDNQNSAKDYTADEGENHKDEKNQLQHSGRSLAARKRAVREDQQFQTVSRIIVAEGLVNLIQSIASFFAEPCWGLFPGEFCRLWDAFAYVTVIVQLLSSFILPIVMSKQLRQEFLKTIRLRKK